MGMTAISEIMALSEWRQQMVQRMRGQTQHEEKVMTGILSKLIYKYRNVYTV